MFLSIMTINKSKLSRKEAERLYDMTEKFLQFNGGTSLYFTMQNHIKPS